MENNKLKKVSCDPMCGFTIQSHDEEEVVDMVKTHGKKAHNMDLKREDVMMKMQYV